ncbi:MAG: ureidoglycolate lyase [Lachnospiraceae bacterium]|uniref:ureidoglycolate lyase n=1 Tax=Parablautia sp. Marseille-Q6255 TaxID=3039593 RepID=UPI0024BCD830|nr:ureidoglycolate lyase [Parablautia sp. Marseille-Q6255]
MRRIESITREAFAAFGSVIEFSPDFEDVYEIVETEEEKPWILAVFRYKNKTIRRLENHPTSMETFEPLAGVTVLLVAEHETPEEYRAFVLDKPVCLKKGVWHQVLSLTPEASVKITENKDVYSEFYDLSQEVCAQIG